MFHNKNKKTRGTDNILLSLDNHFETMSPISLLLTTKQPYQSYDLKMTQMTRQMSNFSYNIRATLEGWKPRVSNEFHGGGAAR